MITGYDRPSVNRQVIGSSPIAGAFYSSFWPAGMSYDGNFRMVLVRSCMACVVWGFCGILARGRFYFRVVRCLPRGSGVLRAGRWKRDVPGLGR